MSEGTHSQQRLETRDNVVVAGRYALHERVGRGGAAAVYAARDEATGERVAVKILDLGPANAPPRVRREVAALRHLHLPGVVALRDSGMHGEQAFLVMEFVEGKPFPGRDVPVRWDELAPVVRSLLEVLGRVHAAGVVHRDLKPSNVLVTASGRVTLLDFGISWGPALGEGVTVVGSVVGTPEYLAPEQFAGHRGDARTDLYGVGVLMYEALTGALPHEASDLLRLIDLKRNLAPTRVRARVPGVPREVGQVVERLLAVDPGDRPQTVGELLAYVFGDDAVAPGTRDLPWLGSQAIVQRLVEAACAGRAVDLHGPPGCGRSRVLVAAAAELEAAGRSVTWIAPGASPYVALRPLIGALDDLADAAHAEALEVIERRVKEALAGGAAVIVDDPGRIDRWTRRALDRCRSAGAVLRVVDERTPGCESIEPLLEADLHTLFAGPERIFHLQTDGARGLWRRTGGHQGRIAAEVAAWVRADLAHWEGEQLVVSRASLHRLRSGLPVGGEFLVRHGPHATRSPELDLLLSWVALAWPNSSIDVVARLSGQPRWQVETQISSLAHDRLVHCLADGRVQPLAVPHALQTWTTDRIRDAHRAIADSLAPGSEARFRHIVAAGNPGEIVHEALALAPRLTRDGLTGDAIVALEQGLAASRDEDDSEGERALLDELAKSALDDGSHAALQRALYESGRAQNRTRHLARVVRLLQSARDADGAGASGALTELDALGSFTDWELELWRHAQRFRAAISIGVDAQERVLNDVEAWGRSVGESRVVESAASWRGLHLRSVGRAAEAGPILLRAAEQGDRVQARLANGVNAAIALVECDDLDAARAVALETRKLAEKSRAPLIEAHCEALIRSVGYRLAEIEEVDEELAEAVGALQDDALEYQVLLTEAAIAWRTEQMALARHLARGSAAAARRTGVPGCDAPARALELLCGAEADPDEFAHLARGAEACPDPETAIQALGLIALLDPLRATRSRSAARSLAETLVSCDPERRRDVLSLAEVFDEVS